MVRIFETLFKNIRNNPFPAPSFEEVQKKVFEIVDKKILVGHGLHNDLDVSRSALFPYFLLTGTSLGLAAETWPVNAERYLAIQTSPSLCTNASRSLSSAVNRYVV